MILPPRLSSRVLTPLAWFAVIGFAAYASNYSTLLSIAPYGSPLRNAVGWLLICLVVPLWIAVIVASAVGIRRWSHDPNVLHIETIVLVTASLALVSTAVLRMQPFNTFWLPFPPLYIPYIAEVFSVFVLTAFLALVLPSKQASTFEAIAVPGLALVLPFALTGSGMGAGTAVSISNWALLASAAVSGLAFAITRERLYIALLAGMGGVILKPFAFLAFLVPTAAMFMPLTRARAQTMFADGAARIALFASGLALAACFGGEVIMMVSPTLRSQSEHASLVLTMRPMLTISASCTALFALCVLTSPLVAFSLLAAAYTAPVFGQPAFEVQCSIIGGSVPIAVASTIARAEWQRPMLDVRSRSVNFVTIMVLLVIGFVCAAIPHPDLTHGG